MSDTGSPEPLVHFFNFLFPVKFLTFFLVMSKEYTKCFNRILCPFNTGIKKLEEKPVVQPVIQPVTESGQIKTLTADIHDLKSKVLDLQCRSMKTILFSLVYINRSLKIVKVNSEVSSDKN